jgi:hypothetical protein
MKSVQRHNLETNWLAKHMKVWIEKSQPHLAKIASVAAAVFLVIVVVAWMSGASASRELEAWDLFNAIVSQRSMMQRSLTELNRAAEEYQDTAIQELASITWADGQVWGASRDILVDRPGATAALDKAASTYQSLIDTSSDDAIVDRAHFGMGRVYELRNEPDKARDEYLLVKGTFAAQAKLRADELAKQKTKRALSWLAMAEAPKVTAPAGGGTPGQRPGFAADDLALPAATAPAGVEPPGETSIEELFKGINPLGIGSGETAPDRYKSDEAAKSGETPAEQPKAGEEKKAGDEKSTPAEGTKAPEGAKAPAGDRPAAEGAAPGGK